MEPSRPCQPFLRSAVKARSMGRGHALYWALLALLSWAVLAEDVVTGREPRPPIVDGAEFQGRPAQLHSLRRLLQDEAQAQPSGGGAAQAAAAADAAAAAKKAEEDAARQKAAADKAAEAAAEAAAKQAAEAEAAKQKAAAAKKAEEEAAKQKAVAEKAAAEAAAKQAAEAEVAKQKAAAAKKAEEDAAKQKAAADVAASAAKKAEQEAAQQKAAADKSATEAAAKQAADAEAAKQKAAAAKKAEEEAAKQKAAADAAVAVNKAEEDAAKQKAAAEKSAAEAAAKQAAEADAAKQKAAAAKKAEEEAAKQKVAAEKAAAEAASKQAAEAEAAKQKAAAEKAAADQAAAAQAAVAEAAAAAQAAAAQQAAAAAQAAARQAGPRRPSRPDGLWTFENDPVPDAVSILNWHQIDAPQELSSSSFLTENATIPDYVAMCLVIRDQQNDVVEWVQHHLRLGISKIYVWDNGSDPPLWNVLQKYIMQGVVVYNKFTTFKHATDRPQLYAYDRCLQDYGSRHQWMVFIDSDEFLIFRDGPPVQSLANMLKDYEDYSGLGVHWILFGSSGHQIRPHKGVLRSYYKCLPLQHTQHTLIKTIANTRCTTGAWGPHAFHHNCSKPVVRTNLDPIDGPRADRPVFDRLALHHYATKSLAEFKEKMQRGSGMRRQRGMEYFWFVDSWSVEFNFDAVRIWDDQTTFQEYPAIQNLQGRYDKLPVHAWTA